jgi:hypothetical protein
MTLTRWNDPILTNSRHSSPFLFPSPFFLNYHVYVFSTPSTLSFRILLYSNFKCHLVSMYLPFDINRQLFQPCSIFFSLFLFANLTSLIQLYPYVIIVFNGYKANLLSPNGINCTNLSIFPHYLSLFIIVIVTFFQMRNTCFPTKSNKQKRKHEKRPGNQPMCMYKGFL